MNKILSRYTFGRWVIVKDNEYYFYWMGKSRKVKDAVEEYLSFNTGEHVVVRSIISQNYIARKYGVMDRSIGNNCHNLIECGIIKAESGKNSLD